MMNKDSFRDRVYKLVTRIPKGKVSTYGDIAKALGNVRLSRAVGVALKLNPKPIEVPCHRVVKSNGELGGYSYGGLDMKKRLLKAEGIEISGIKIKNFEKVRYKF